MQWSALWVGASLRIFEQRYGRARSGGRHYCRVGNRAFASPGQSHQRGRLVGLQQVVFTLFGCAAYLKHVVYRLLRVHVIRIVFGISRNCVCAQDSAHSDEVGDANSDAQTGVRPSAATRMP